MILKIGIILFILFATRYIYVIETQTKRMKSNLKPGDTVIYYIGEERYSADVVEVDKENNTAIIEVQDELYNVSIDDLYAALTYKYN